MKRSVCLSAMQYICITSIDISIILLCHFCYIIYYQTSSIICMLHNIVPNMQKPNSQEIDKCLFIITFDKNRSLQQSSFMVDVNSILQDFPFYDSDP